MRLKIALALLLLLALLVQPMDAATERKGDVYPLNVCAVAGEELGSMGDPIVHVGEDGKEVRFCCKGCVKKYTANPASYNEKVDAQILALQADKNPLAGECIKTGKALDGDGVSFVAGNRAMKTCCKNCMKAVQADPAEYIAKVDAAIIEAGKDSYPLKTCIVGGSDLDGDAVDVVVAGTHFRTCCKNCAGKIGADPQAFLSKLAEATK